MASKAASAEKHPGHRNNWIVPKIRSAWLDERGAVAGWSQNVEAADAA